MIDTINQLAVDMEKAIEDKIKEFWITEENAKDYHIETEAINTWFIYRIYRKEKIWEFITNYFNN